MKQSDNAIHISADGSRVFIPCACGDDADRITLTHFPGDDEDPIFIGVNIEAGYSLRSRIAAAWRALVGREHRDSVGMSRATASALATWLAEKAA